MLTIILCLWLAWIAFHLLCMAVANPHVPCLMGFRLVMPEALRALLTPDEFEAVRQHELGHRHHWHIWKNFALVCVFMRASPYRRQMQEFEADDYAWQGGHAIALASALRKISTHPLDLYRALRLETIQTVNENLCLTKPKPRTC